jgi:prepilin-type N-terminal cleavage/methylation domain-containing protein
MKTVPPPGAGRRTALRRARKAAFTLIEMLVVVLIIATLVGLVFKLIGGAGRATEKAATIAKLERLKTALEEFYAEYGQYPPVPYYNGAQPVSYEYPSSNLMRRGLVGFLADSDTNPGGLGWGDAPIFTFGMLAFLVPRYQDHADQAYHDLFSNNQWRNYNSEDSDLERDRVACQRWWPFIEGILDESHWQDRAIGSDMSRAYTNRLVRVEDGWERDFLYESPPPHQSYKLYSVGPDGTKGTSDDIVGGAGH